MQLDFSDQEVAVIGGVLRNYLGDLRMEIRDTENYEFRQGLKQDEQIIVSFLARLPELAPIQD